ncbi:MAG TPA: hypothetical protein ENJ53_03970 [Phaeodactylibacter sp.]|nr:hypothetical protein [Phaeodactylibacter sp.]
MKNLTHSFLLFSILLFSVSIFSTCKKHTCLSDEKIGDLELHANTLFYMPYSGSEKLVFKNATGDSLILQSTDGKRISKEQLCVETTCTDPKIKGNSTCKYFEGESQRIIFQNTEKTILIDILITSEVYEPNTQKFYDFLQVGISVDDYNEVAGFVTHTNFSGPINNEKTVIQNFLIGDTYGMEINNKFFGYPLVFEGNPLKFYYNGPHGVIRFATPDEVWNLDHVE